MQLVRYRIFEFRLGIDLKNCPKIAPGNTASGLMISGVSVSFGSNVMLTT